MGGSYGSHFHINMIDYVTTFFAIFILDIVYTQYLKNVKLDNALSASFWAMFCYGVNSFAIVNFTEDRYLMIPAILGAFLGTYVGIKINK